MAYNIEKYKKTNDTAIATEVLRLLIFTTISTHNSGAAHRNSKRHDHVKGETINFSF